jgi:hypothetical protein
MRIFLVKNESFHEGIRMRQVGIPLRADAHGMNRCDP